MTMAVPQLMLFIRFITPVFLHAGIVPHIPENPGTIRWPGPPIGAHTREVLSEFLNMSAAQIEALRNEKVL